MNKYKDPVLTTIHTPDSQIVQSGGVKTVVVDLADTDFEVYCIRDGGDYPNRKIYEYVILAKEECFLKIDIFSEMYHKYDFNFTDNAFLKNCIKGLNLNFDKRLLNQRRVCLDFSIVPINSGSNDVTLEYSITIANADIRGYIFRKEGVSEEDKINNNVFLNLFRDFKFQTLAANIDKLKEVLG